MARDQSGAGPLVQKEEMVPETILNRACPAGLAASSEGRFSYAQRA